MTRVKLAGLLFVFATGLTSCGLPQQKPIPPDAPALEAYTRAEVEEEAAALLIAINVGDELRSRIMARLGELFADPGFAPKIESPGITGVGAFQVGSGGAILMAGAGSGLVSFSGGDQRVRFEVKGFSMGAAVGGENTFGVVLVVGLEHEEKFPDQYQTRGTGGTIAGTSYKVGQAEAKRGHHMLHYVGSGIGLAASAGSGQVTIEVPE